MSEAERDPGRLGTPFRALLRFALVSALVLAITIAALWTFRHEVAHHLFLWQLAALGLEEASVGETRIEPGSLELSALRLGARPDLEVDRVVARFSTRSLLAGRLDALEISGLRVAGAVDESGLSFGALDALLFGESEADDAAELASALPATRIVIEQAALEVTTEAGPVASSWTVQAHELGDRRVEVTARVRADHARASFESNLRAVGTPEVLEGEIDWRGRAEALSAGGYTLRDGSLDGSAGFVFDRGTIRLSPRECVTVAAGGLEAADLGKLEAPIRLCLRSENVVEVANDGVITAAITIDPTPFAFALAGEIPTPIEGTLPELTLDLGSDEETGAQWVGLSSRGGRLRYPAAGIEAAGIRLESARVTAALEGRLRIAKIRDLDETPDFPQVSLDARFEPIGDALHFDARFSGANGSFTIAASGEHDLERGTGRARIELVPVDLGSGGTALADLIPFLGGIVESSQGSIEAIGEARWGSEGFATEIDLAADDVHASTDLAAFEAINATVEILDTATRPRQVLSISRLDFGLELTNGLLTYQLRPDGVITLDSATWSFAGGTLETSGEIDLASEAQPITLTIRGVDLETLLARVNLDGLSGAGTLDGELPLVRQPDEIVIRGASLRSVGKGGWLRYRPEGGAENLGSVDANMSNVMTILENFHYDTLEIGIDGSARGDVVVSIRLRGNNPDYLDGFPVDFNLNVDARLVDLLRAEAAIVAIPDVVTKRLEQFHQRARAHRE